MSGIRPKGHRPLTTEQLLTSLVGWLISAIFKYLPALRNRFERLNGLGKRLTVITFSLIASAAVFLFKCGGANVPILEPCTQAGLLPFLNIALTVAINTQAAYLLLPPVVPKPTYPQFTDNDIT